MTQRVNQMKPNPFETSTRHERVEGYKDLPK